VFSYYFLLQADPAISVTEKAIIDLTSPYKDNTCSTLAVASPGFVARRGKAGN